MYKSTLLAVILAFSSTIFGQKQANKEQLYFMYFKTWNFLKYYHPDLASGKRDADSLFFSNLSKLPAAEDQEAVHKFFRTMVTDLSVPKSQAGSIKPKDGLVSNIDFSWRERPEFFDPGTIQKLSAVFENRYIGNNHYYLPEQSFNAELPHEKEYAFGKDENIPLEYRLLALAKIQGVVDYLYPHKYLMTPANEFDFLLRSVIARMFRYDDRVSYELVLLKLSACLQDSHSYNFYRQMTAKKKIFNSSVYPPFAYKVFEDGILVTQLIVPQVCQQADIKEGDYITKINGRPVKRKIEELAKLLSTSNRATLLHHLSNYADNLVWGSESKDVSVEITRNSGNQMKKILFIASGDSNLKLLNEYLTSLPSNKAEDGSLIVLNNEIAYFRIDNVFRLIEHVEDARIDHQMDSILDLAGNKKGIIFDMRGYPDWGGFVPAYVVKHFGKDLVPYAKYFQANKQQIGTYTLKEALDTYYNPDLKPEGAAYKGKVVMIVNPATQSMSEWNTMCLQHVFPDAVTIGEQSAGADGDLKTMNLPGGYTFDFTGNAIFYPDGTEAQRKGVKINIPVRLTKENYSKDSDYLLQRAIELIEK
ncbi:S41 family peptidase [Fluviicola sp.]|uniref:S41 family peptidase n=1 Tax=Fluviicola sp. TaxID=1917219 RepID=UPI0031DB0176